MASRVMAVVVTSTVVVLCGAWGNPGEPTALGARTGEEADSVAIAVYEGRTPCGEIATEFTGFPSLNCEKVKWEVTLFADRRTGQPRAFVYDGTRTTRRGTWTVHRGTPFDPDAEVYRLTPLPSGRTLSLLHVDGRVLLLLDRELRVVPGDAGYSYALNRTDKRLVK